MLAIGLELDIGEARFFQADMTRGATIRDSDVRMPDLLNSRLKVPLQRDCFAPRTDHAEVALLVVPPFAEVIFGGRNREQHEQDRAHDRECAQGVAE